MKNYIVIPLTTILLGVLLGILGGMVLIVLQVFLAEGPYTARYCHSNRTGLAVPCNQMPHVGKA